MAQPISLRRIRLERTNMLKTITVLSFGCALAGAAAANAGEPSRTLTYKLYAHRAVHRETVDPRARMFGPELRMGVPLGATSPAREMGAADPPHANEGCLWGLERYNGVSCP
jgi:hypothetical protein